MATLNVRLTDQEAEEVETYRQRLQEKYGTKVKVTQRTVFLEALDLLGAALKEASQPNPDDKSGFDDSRSPLVGQSHSSGQ